MTPSRGTRILSIATLVLTLIAFGATLGSAQTVVATIDVGKNPFGITVDAKRARAYTARAGLTKGAKNDVYVIDTTTNQKIDTIRVGQGPTDVAVDPKTGLLYVTSNGGCCVTDNRVFVVEPTTHAVVQTITVVDDPEWIEINRETRRAYVTSVFGGVGHSRVAVIDLSTNALQGFIEVGEGQGAVAVDEVKNLVYIGRYVAEGDTSVSEVVIIDGSNDVIIDRIQLAFPLVRSTLALVRGLAPDPHSNLLYVGHRNSDLISVLDIESRSVVATIPVGAAPHGVLFNPDDGRVYVGNAFSNSVSVIDAGTREVVATVPVGEGSRFLALNPKTKQLYVTNVFDKTVSVIDVAQADH